MSREVRRVPLDFDWPINKVWDGYLSPKWRECPAGNACENGSTIGGRWLECLAHLILMCGDAARDTSRPLHPWLAEIPLAPRQKPSADMAALTAGLAGRDGSPFGHDACDRWSATKAIAKSAGMADDWGVCPSCNGHAIHPDDLAASEAWRGTDPPTGEGWQFWETVSEGSPQSPVFATREELVDWLVTHERYSREGAEAFTKLGYSIGSFVMIGGQFISGVEAAAMQPTQHE